MLTNVYVILRELYLTEYVVLRTKRAATTQFKKYTKVTKKVINTPPTLNNIWIVNILIKNVGAGRKPTAIDKKKIKIDILCEPTCQGTVDELFMFVNKTYPIVDKI